MFRFGTWVHELVVALSVLGTQLDLMVSEGFSNQNDSMILVRLMVGTAGLSLDCTSWLGCASVV